MVNFAVGERAKDGRRYLAGTGGGEVGLEGRVRAAELLSIALA